MGDSKKMLQVRSARQTAVRVRLLDDETFQDSVDKRAIGWVLFDRVCESLNIIERDYFGLSYVDPTGTVYWLNNDKKISKQMKGMNWDFNFEVKFYPPDPAQLQEDLTRYQLCLQLRRDIVNEKLPGSFVTYTLLGSYTAQSELGDYDTEEFGHGTRYLKDIKFAPYQDKELLQKICELHKHHRGQTPEQAEMNFLENAKKLSRYGVELHPATDAEGTDICLGVCASGLIVYKKQQNNRLEQINRFVWPKVLKMSYRRNKYYVKIRPGEFEHFASLIGFRLLNVKLAKRLWKISVEHHSFFRFREPEPTKSVSVFPRFGSRFRYSGRTQFQTRQAVVQEDRPAPAFDRVLSKRSTFHGRTNNKTLEQEMRSAPVRRPPPAVAPKPQIKPKPAPRGPPSVDDNMSDKGSLGPEIDKSFEEEPDRKSKMEKMHAVATPLAAVMVNSQKKEKEHDHPPPDSDSNSHGPPGYTSDDPEEHRHRREEGHEDILVETIDQGVAEPPQSRQPMSLKERKMMEKQEKERQKREKEEEKRRKKEEEKERKRMEKEKKALIAQEKKAAKQKSKQKGKVAEEVPERRDSKDSRELNRDIGRGWEEAVNQEPRSPATPERTRKRLSSFEDLKTAVDKERPPTPPEPLPPKDKGQRDDDSVGGSASASGSGSWHSSDEEDEEDRKKDAGRDHEEIDGEEVSF